MTGHKPAYRAEGDQVLKNPVTTEQSDGSKSVTLGFPICTVSEWATGENETGAQALARMLSERDRLREQNAAMLEALKAAVPKLQAYYIATLDRGIGVQIDTIVVQCQRVITEAEAGND